MSSIYLDKMVDEPALFFTIPFAPGMVIDCMPFENRACLRRCDMPQSQVAQKQIPALPPLATRLQRLSVLPNNRCNFNCSYCYAARSRDRSELDETTLIRAIECFFSLPDRRDLSVSFLGGGEPLLSWALVRSAIAFIRSKSMSVPINIVSNGSILTDEMTGFFRENGVSLTISFEILEDVQNSQRGEYARVDANIGKLLACGIPLKIRTILTDRNIHLIKNMADVVSTRYAGISKWLVEPVSAWSYFDDAVSAGKFWRDYREAIAEMERLPSLKNIPWNSLLKRFFAGASACYCDGEFVVMPSGKIGLCHRVSSPDDELGDKWSWGFFDGEKYHLDSEKAENFYRLPEKMRSICGKCPAFACCGGNCRVMANQASGEYIKDNCEFIRQCFFDHIKSVCTAAVAAHPDDIKLPFEFKLWRCSR